MPKHTLSKSNYLQYLDCPEELWLWKNRRELIPEEAEDTKFKIEQGDLIDVLAQRWFEEGAVVDGVKIPPSQASYQDDLRVDGFIAISDVLVRHEDGSVSIFEVKGSTTVKKKHIYDSAFQRMVFERKGYTVRDNYMVLVDRSFVYEGDIDKHKILTTVNITEKVKREMSATRKRAVEALAFINGPEPAARITAGCSNKEHCAFVQLHHPKFPTYNVYDILRIHKKKLKMLVGDGILDIKDVPKDFPLSKRQRRQVDIAQSGETEINKRTIRRRLKKLKYPLYFLDYETFAYVFPAQKGYRPYQQMVFQYSLHVLESPGAELEHHGYILKEREESVEELIKHMKKHLREDGGSVLVWSENFEKSRNEEMAERYPKHAPFLEDINSRTFDLMEIFKDELYVSPGFKGSYSIKKVLPILCPDLSYSGLDINNGAMATISWHKMTQATTSKREQKAIYKDLVAYCHLDTMAMVRIWEELMEI